MPFYAVARGKNPGIYPTWPECEAQVKGFNNARYKKFNTREEAEEFCKVNGGNTNGTNVPKFTNKAGASTTTASTKSSSSSGNKRKYPFDNAPSKSSSAKKATMSASSWAEAGERGDYSDTVIVYTDGACTQNGRKGAKAGIGVYFGDGHPDNVSAPLEGKPTNNRAEIKAVCVAVELAKKRGHKSVTIRTDSKFLLQSITTWVPNWIKKNWTLSTGGPVKNKEDFQELLKAMQGIEVRWEKVRAHSGIDGNEKADRLAVEGARKCARN